VAGCVAARVRVLLGLVDDSFHIGRGVALMPWAIVISTLIASLAYVIPKLYAITVQENMVRLQIESLMDNTSASGSVDETQVQFDMNGPYH
jgi:hypothetical protein